MPLRLNPGAAVYVWLKVPLACGGVVSTVAVGLSVHAYSVDPSLL